MKHRHHQLTRRAPRCKAVCIAVVLLMALPGGVALGADTGLRRFLLRSGEQQGFSVHGPLRTWTDARWILRAFPAAAQPSDVRALRAAGFMAGISEDLRARDGRLGFSEVLQFRQASGAVEGASLLLQLTWESSIGPDRVLMSTVPGVPGADVLINRAGGAAVANAFWADGRCTMASGVGVFRANGQSNAAIARAVIAGVQSQRRRIPSCP